MNARASASIAQRRSTVHTPTQNHLLATLPIAELNAMTPDLELVSMQLGDTIGEPGTSLQYAYFPTTAVVSMHYLTSTGALAETAAVGREGVVGIALFMGGESTPSSTVVKCAGHGYRLAREPLARSFARSGTLRNLLLRYTQGLIAQICQTAACYRHHTIEQQLSRWLLSTFDRMPQRELVMTQELVAALLGVRRESISDAASKLRDDGYIRYRRGHISIIDPIGLEKRACECYSVIKAELQRLLPIAATTGGSPLLKGTHV
jgi:CRP-like cAMP-binding protein